jgi:hypothetical protein
MSFDDAVLRQYTIYLDAVDLGEGYAVREWLIQAGGARAGDVLAQNLATLQEARRRIPMHADVCFGRSDTDPPVVVETWT